MQEKDTFRSIPYTAVGLSAVATVLWLALYMLEFCYKGEDEMDNKRLKKADGFHFRDG